MTNQQDYVHIRRNVMNAAAVRGYCIPLVLLSSIKKATRAALDPDRFILDRKDQLATTCQCPS